MLTEKEYYSTIHFSLRMVPYINIIPCLILNKSNPTKAEPEYDIPAYKGWGIHIGILCFAIDFNW